MINKFLNFVEAFKRVDKKQGFINLTRYLALLITTYIIFCFIFVVYDIYSNFYLSPQLMKSSKLDDKQYIIAIVSPSTRPGERQQAEMIKDSAQKMGHLVYYYSFNDSDMAMFLPARYMNEFFLYILSKIFKPDVHLAMSFHIDIDLPDPKIMYISVPPEYYVARVQETYTDVKNYNNFLDINLINSNDDWLSPILHKKINRYYGIVGVPANTYKSSEHNRLLIFGSLWGRKTNNLYGAINKLAKEDYMFFIKHNYLILEDKKIQKFADPADNFLELQERLNQYGIGLCAHSKYHLKAGIPSSRIFEIISSGALAISDLNPFIIKFFGDNVLYYDQTAPADEIYNQINAHVRWAQENPLEANKKARNAHKILQEKFTTELFIEDMIKVFPKSKN